MPQQRNLAVILTIMLASVLASSAAAAIVASSIASSFSPSAPSPSAPPVTHASPADLSKLASVTRSAVAFYKPRTGASPLDRLHLPSDEAGAGLVLTADGWIATAASVFDGHDSLLAVFSDGTAAAVSASALIRDTATGLAFAKTSVERLPVASFGTGVPAGNAVYGVGLDKIVAASELGASLIPVASKLDYVESSEKLSRRMMLDREVPVGSAIADASGNAVGISDTPTTAVPSSYIAGVLRGIFRDGRVERPTAGIHYVSADLIHGAAAAGLPASGAYVTGGGKYRAAEKGSPAEAAGLKEGDVIEAVEHDRINSEATLFDRLQDYAPGSKVELSVRRGNSVLRLAMTLK